MPRNTDTSAMTQWHKDQKLLRIQLYVLNPRLYLRCKKPLPFGSDKRQVYCGHSCSASDTNRMRRKGPTHCLSCQTLLSPDQVKYCNKSCQHAYQGKIYIESWLNGEVVSTADKIPTPIRRHMLEEANHKCSKCGWGEINPTTGKTPLNVDHINGKATDHRKENLRVLCPNCHSLTPNYGALNKGSGRKRRYRALDIAA